MKWEHVRFSRVGRPNLQFSNINQKPVDCSHRGMASPVYDTKVSNELAIKQMLLLSDAVSSGCLGQEQDCNPYRGTWWRLGLYGKHRPPGGSSVHLAHTGAHRLRSSPGCTTWELINTSGRGWSQLMHCPAKTPDFKRIRVDGAFQESLLIDFS